jgi:hypothetical protein
MLHLEGEGRMARQNYPQSSYCCKYQFEHMKSLSMFYIINVHHILYCIQNQLLSLGKIKGRVETELANLENKMQVCAFLLSHFISCIQP